MDPLKRSKRLEGGGLQIVNVKSAGVNINEAVLIKEELQSDSENSVEDRAEFTVKREPESDSGKSMSESECPASSEIEDNQDAEESSKKKFKRIIVLDDDSSDSEGPIGPPLKKRKFKRVKQENSESRSDEVRESHKVVDESCSGGNDESSSESSSESSKGVIEFESSSESDGDATEKSYTSSENEEVDDGDLKRECILCRNLGKRDFRFRTRTNSTDWCRCGECRIIGRMRDYDRICCREIKDVTEFLDEEMDDATKKHLCITSHPRFEIDVLQFQALQRTHYYRTNHYGNTPGYMASWSFIRWIWNKLGWGNRMVIPSCVSSKIKEKFGSDGVACYAAVSVCETARHCRQSQK
ncbi:unnamed protein product [Allacma fusca]|uniref:P2X purinoreceptor 7 intracellular domain-containing protein n=2 Tax=Allacma fusca TaxID=39272 RepID=A0A8J2LTV9_9HEXA|nr:unnamed protein product [Allacma fusca]